MSKKNLLWKKIGCIFSIRNKYDWAVNYSWVPTCQLLNQNGDCKVYFSTRNQNNLSQTGYITINLNNPFKLLDISKKPILKLGNLGAFDDSLIVGCSIVSHNTDQYFYYVGWTQTKKTRYLPHIGLAISNDNGKSFSKFSNAPLIPLNNEDYLGMASPFVYKDHSIWRLWYASYRRWEIRKNESWPIYELRYAESKNGIDWKLFNKNIFKKTKEEAIARPFVRVHNGKYEMWYTYRELYKKYNIGYATSLNGLDWKRQDELVGIERSNSGWDSEMLCYPYIINYNNKEYLFYNGNNHGETGIGLAIRDTQ